MPAESFGGVDVLNGIEAVTSCQSCRTNHWPALCQMDGRELRDNEPWRGENGG